MKKILILGSTGSIGTQALDVAARHPDRFKVVGLAAGNNVDLLKAQIETFHPEYVFIARRTEAEALKARFPSTVFFHAQEDLAKLVEEAGADLVISAIVGAAGLKPTMRALECGQTVALANKESLVIAGEVMTGKAKEKGLPLIPIDSEHSAVFQALAGNRRQDVRRILLTASGGPFLKRAADTFDAITPEEALKHPKWKMGAKITIDSATLMNKGLEVIEASWLFELPAEKIGVHVHPQSIVHSMVEYIDGSVMAQMGVPDMRCAISYAMAYPERIDSGVDSLDLFRAGPLEFYEPDLKKFPCLALAYEAVRVGKTMPAVLNAANETAVDYFLNRQIRFTDIPRLIEKTMGAHRPWPLASLDDVQEADRWARRHAVETFEEITL